MRGSHLTIVHVPAHRVRATVAGHIKGQVEKMHMYNV